MRGLFAFTIFTVLAASNSYAQSLETVDQARQRQDAERYQQYQQNNNSAPLGGYNEKLGDPAPVGTERPGYTTPQGYGGGIDNGHGHPRGQF